MSRTAFGIRMPGNAKNQSCNMPRTTAQRNSTANRFMADLRRSKRLEILQQLPLLVRSQPCAVEVAAVAVAQLRGLEAEELAAVGRAVAVRAEADPVRIVLVVAAEEL